MKRYYQKNKEKIKKYRQENKEGRREYMRKWRQEHPEKDKKYYQKNEEKIKKYRQKNKEKISENKKKYYQKNEEKIKKYRQKNEDKIKKYRQENKEKLRENAKKWCQKNKEKVRLYVHTRRTRKNNATGTYTMKQIKELRKISEGMCNGWKRQPHLVGEENLTIDHITPLSKGGNNDISNVQLLCKSCNSSKGVKVGGRNEDVEKSKCV